MIQITLLSLLQKEIQRLKEFKVGDKTLLTFHTCSNPEIGEIKSTPIMGEIIEICREGNFAIVEHSNEIGIQVLRAVPLDQLR